MQRLASVLGILCVVAAAGCSKKSNDDQAPPAPAPAKAQAPAFDPAALASAIGIAPGAVMPDDDAGADAVATGEGELELRRLGAELFEPHKGELKLWAGDQVRTGAGGSATIVLADQSVVELAEQTAVAIGDRDAGADPASSVAVLYGVARFSVSPRGPGEGPFLVFTPAGVVAAKGTTYGVGVAVDGSARVAVEEGEVEVAGQADPTATVSVPADQQLVISPAGELPKPAAVEGDWGAWRDGTEADADPKVLVRDHRAQLDVLVPAIDADYGELADLTTEAHGIGGQAADYEAAGNTAGYADVEPGWGASIEASFLASLRLEQLTFAALSHAYIAEELYARHPDQVGPIWVDVRPRIRGAVLYEKKYEAAVHADVAPIRPLYYRHHPRGRAHAAAVAVTLPPFYRGKLKPLPDGAVRARLKMKVYRPMFTPAVDHKKTVIVAAPPVGWRAKVQVAPHAHAHGRWYARPATPRARLMVGVKVVNPLRPVFRAAAAPIKRAALKVELRGHGQGRAHMGVRGRMHKPSRVEMRAGGGAGAKVKVKAVGPRGKVKAGVVVEPRASVPLPKVKMPKVKVPKVKAGVRVKAGGRLKIGGPKKRGGKKKH